MITDSPVLLALQRATHATLQLITAELADLDLTAAEINALANLADGKGCTVSELGAAIGTRPTTLTSVLDRLERRECISRTAHPTDRRAVLIELTDRGRTTASAISEGFARVESRALEHVDAAAIAGFHTVVEALREAGR
ncbi:MarR family winged helix-turn-helix transcriptional regulator [Nocardia seriolae]|uniref:MarR family transcriptional regulator n=1 Tax=Nocardia seriolae TaxID=37332 RepID=A0ABC9YRN0_9NOCA|nr:MarR family transcriptional regulator [Nocardia seriolae]WKY51178.1 MarR family transcriptional regulator [Nocardia seriolae]WNJ57867.1 MarR family transcriptional regulator [Nocardia seriolae]BAW04877.1 MarR family transcriptional regulator [Nocardia seriolae]BEK90514.1 hypothetical protein NSERKGN1266_64650 [Nocardia seriolae]BEK98263.1 hypothetical protein NSER024013_61690 [Nocardia seriolae]